MPPATIACIQAPAPPGECIHPVPELRPVCSWQVSRSRCGWQSAPSGKVMEGRAGQRLARNGRLFLLFGSGILVQWYQEFGLVFFFLFLGAQAGWRGDVGNHEIPIGDPRNGAPG